MKFSRILVLAIALAMVLSSFAFAEGAIKIGHIGPLTGPAANYGNATERGAAIAVEEINALGGLQFEFKSEDDEHDAEKSVNAYNSLYDWGVQMIVGTTTTTPCIAVGAVANTDRVFMLTPSASSTDVIDPTDNIFQVCFTDPAQGTASAQYIAEHQLATDVAVIYNNADAYSTGIYQTFIEEAAGLGLNVVSTSTFTDDTTDFSPMVTAAKNSGATLVFLPIYYTPAYNILQQSDAQGYKPIFFGVDGMDGILGLENIDVSLTEGVMLLTPFSADAEDELTVNFVTKYQETYGEIPNQFAADAYDAVYALYKACEYAGITADTPVEECCELLIDAMQNIEVVGVTGTMSWDENGAVTKTPTAVVIQGGVYVGA